MQYFYYVLIFLSGAFLCNSIPHLAAGLRGERFPTPFAKPRGVGLSSPVTNFMWGFLNIAIGFFMVRRGLQLEFSVVPFIVMAGFLMAGTYLSVHFGRVRAGQI